MGRKSQTEIPGTERKKNVAVSSAAADLREVRMARIDLQRKEKGLAERLIEKMREAGIVKYIDEENELKVERVETKEKVKVVAYKIDGTSTDDDDEDPDPGI